MSEPLNIIHITHDGRGAGSSVSVALLARAQKGAGHRVAVVSPPGYLADRAMASGVIWRAMDFSSIGAVARSLQCMVDGDNVDVVNAHSSRARSACRRLRLAGRLRCALVMTRRAMPRSTLPSAIFSGLAADRVIAVSRAVAGALARRGTPRSRIAVVYNAVDLERIDEPVSAEALAAAKAQIPDGAIVGVVSRLKDHETLVRAMARVPATLVSLGFEPNASTFRRSSGSTPSGSTLFLPFQDPRPFYPLFDVVALPTNDEGLSQGLMEAMALGKPVVTTRVAANEELIEDGVHGLLVPPRDPVAMGEAINRLLQDRVLASRLGAAARDRARSLFTIARTLEATDAVYRAAIARRAA